MPPARPNKSPAPQRPTPTKAAGKAKAGKATDAASDSDDAEPMNGQNGHASNGKSPAKGSKAPAAAKAKAAAAPPSAPAAKAAPSTLAAALVLLLALAAGAYTALAPGKLKSVPKLGPKAFDGLDLKLSGGHTGVAMVGFTCAAALCFFSCPHCCVHAARSVAGTRPLSPPQALAGARQLSPPEAGRRALPLCSQGKVV